MRLYDADAGEIRIGGQRVEAIPPEVLHTKFGVVFQNDILFADTIAENIDFGRGLPGTDRKKRPPVRRRWSLSSRCPTDSNTG